VKYTAQEEYGLRCILQIARNEEKGMLTIDEIAQHEGITPHYAGKLLRILMKGGLIESVRGKQGGYRLSRPAVQMSVGEILNILGGRLFESENCKKYTGHKDKCANSTDCSVRALWLTLDRIIDNVLSNTMLKDLLIDERHVNEWLRYGLGANKDIDRITESTGRI